MGGGKVNIGTCTCTVDEEPLDPALLDDSVGGCDNSPLLNIPQTEFTLAVTKQREPNSFQIAFANAGDKSMKYNITTIRANETWLVTPRAGLLIGCDLGTVTVALPTWNLTARSDAYILQLELTSNSYRDATRNLSVVAFVSAEPVSSLSYATITSPITALSAGSSVDFVVTPIDAAEMPILDTSNQAYYATLSHPESNMSVTCRVVFDTSSGEQQGTCEIPALVCNADTQCSTPVGVFSIGVAESGGVVVGATQSFNVESCPASFYINDGTCLQCADHVDCLAGSTISEWRLDDGYWRADEESANVYECLFWARVVPGHKSPQRRELFFFRHQVTVLWLWLRGSTLRGLCPRLLSELGRQSVRRLQRQKRARSNIRRHGLSLHINYRWSSHRNHQKETDR